MEIKWDQLTPRGNVEKVGHGQLGKSFRDYGDLIYLYSLAAWT